jgi:hypothetical protein
MILPIESNVYVETERLPRIATKPERKTSIFKELKMHSRRIGVILLNAFFGHTWIYFLIGLANKYIFNKPIKSIFMLYPANEKYTKAYVYLWYARSMKWKPRLVGLLKQNEKWGFIFGISATEEDFANPENISNLKKVEARLERIKILLGADQKTFAGILPGIFFSKGIVANPIERDVTVKAVIQALGKIRANEGLPLDVTVIVLGGEGFIGSTLRKVGNSIYGNFYSLDMGEEEHFLALTEKLRGKPIILLNVTKKGALSFYTPYLWPEVVVVNEVYPEPNDKELADIKARGATCYHIIGTKGKAWPGFPRGYAGGIPCCASFWPQDGRGYDVLIKKL